MYLGEGDDDEDDEDDDDDDDGDVDDDDDDDDDDNDNDHDHNDGDATDVLTPSWPPPPFLPTALPSHPFQPCVQPLASRLHSRRTGTLPLLRDVFRVGLWGLQFMLGF